MTTKELLETLSNCKFHQKYQEAKNPKPVQEIKKPEINWEERREKKNKLFKKYLTIALYSLGILAFFIILPIWLVYPPYGKSFLLSLPPILFITLSWMGAAWWAWDKDKYIFMAVTFGAMPLRIGLGLFWVYICFSIPGINWMILIFSMMAGWVIFTIIEVAMVREFSIRLPGTLEIEKGEI